MKNPFVDDLPRPIMIPKKLHITATIASFCGSLATAWHGWLWTCGALFLAMVVLLLIANINDRRIRNIEEAYWK